MASYYNHSSKNIPDPDELPDSGDSLINAISSAEVAKMEQVRLAKLWTDKSWQEIAAIIKSSVSEAKKIWREYRASEEFKIEEVAEPELRKQLEQSDMMLMELYNAWNESKKPLEKTKFESGVTGKGEIDKTTTETIERLPNPVYMTQILAVMKHRAELTGLSTHTNIIFNQQNNQFNVVGAGKKNLIPEEHLSFTKKTGYGSTNTITEVPSLPENLND